MERKDENMPQEPMATPREQVKFLLRYLLFVLLAVMIAPIVITLIANFVLR